MKQHIKVMGHGSPYCDPWPMWPIQNCDPLPALTVAIYTSDYDGVSYSFKIRPVPLSHFYRSIKIIGSDTVW